VVTQIEKTYNDSEYVLTVEFDPALCEDIVIEAERKNDGAFWRKTFVSRCTWG